MSATKIILKRSSILGKRPNSSVIEPGELALNTNAGEPGLFFEVQTGETIKVGPTAVSPSAPVTNPERGESWLNLVEGTLNIGTVEEAQKVWRSIASPFLGGKGHVVFVAPEFPYSTDSTLSDGQTLPYQTLSRAVLQLSKQIVLDTLSGVYSRDTVRYMIYFAPSRLTVNNGAGVQEDALNVGPDGEGFPEYDYIPTISELQQFNSELGGLIIPRGITIKGMDLKKCEMHPCYVPSYKHPVEAFGGTNQPISSILRLTGNCYVENFSVLDKVDFRQVYKVTVYSQDKKSALFHSIRPHGLERNDKVYVEYSGEDAQVGRNFSAGQYNVLPVDTYTFLLTEESLSPNVVLGDVDFILYNAVVPDSTYSNIVQLYVSNDLHSAHRLRAWGNASEQELSQYYEKVQRAFPKTFGEKIVNGENLIGGGETIIVAPVDGSFPDNFNSNSVRNSSAYLNQVNLRSEYGMCGGEADGDVVQGFKSVILNACTVVSLQRDPAAYEVYANLDDLGPDAQIEEKWWPLAEATYLKLPASERPPSITGVTREQQLKTLNETTISQIRYYYLNQTVSSGASSTSGGSIGIVDTNVDFRHFGYRAINSAYIQAQSTYTIGCAVGVWALNGGFISLTNSTTNFGSVAFKSEGFRGIGSLDGAYDNSRGYLFSGIQTPLALSNYQVEDNNNKQIFSLGSKISDVYYDPEDPGVQLIELAGDFLPCYLLPFSLKPGTAVWVSTRDCFYRAFFATDGGPTVVQGVGACSNVILRVRASDSTIPTDPDIIQAMDIPYIRRFRDPREPMDRSYSLVVQNTSGKAIAPSVGSVLRLDQTAQSLGTSSLQQGVQLDPGTTGGWGRVFTVDSVAPATRGFSPNFNYVIGDTTQDTTYLVTLTASDIARPWNQESNQAQGSYVTYKNRNWYAAENNMWETVYYGDINPSFGPTKISPLEVCSPFVDTSVLERQDIIGDTYQGAYAKDPRVVDPGAEEYKLQTYFRGATYPYTEYSTLYPFDGDDGSASMGMVSKKKATSTTTITVTDIKNDSSTVVQTEQLPSSTNRYRPEIIEFKVLSGSLIPNPRQTTSIIKLSNQTVINGPVEYLQVISLVGNQVQAIRLNRFNSLYDAPYVSGQVKPEWDKQTLITVCQYSNEPEPESYDPHWTNTQVSLLRFLTVMGYPEEILPSGLLQPQYWGQRVKSYTDLPATPVSDGYAKSTSAWPLCFNQPSTVVANTHTWAYCGYPFYSKGLPKYQTNEISRKLSYDFQSTTLWGGRLTVTGINDKGELVSFGPQREAVTAQYYENNNPLYTLVGQQDYEDQSYVEFPGQVTVYSTDNISEFFDGQRLTFELTKGGAPIPNGQLSEASLFVQLGAVTQKPGVDYTLVNNTIIFSSAPLSNSICDIRVVTSEDSNKTLLVVPFTLEDNTETAFTFSSNTDIKNLDINDKNTFVFLGGVEQIPGEAYVLSRVGDDLIQVVFTEPVGDGAFLDVRAICSGSYWEAQGKQPVAVYSLDSLSSQFNGNVQQRVFALTYQGKAVNPSLLYTENVFVAVGGVMQLPYESYTIENGFIIFSEPPLQGSTSNLRVVTNAEQLACTNSKGLIEGFLSWGPSVVLDLTTELAEVKNQLDGQG